MAPKNTADLWDGVWTKPATVDRDLHAVAKEERLIRWQRIERTILERFGGFADLSVIEIGAGRGTNAALMAQRGATVTVLDYSERALERARALFEELELSVELLRCDALDLPEGARGKYDVSMSFGLAEHFLAEKRTAILRAHFDLLKEGGITFISVPNQHNPPYRLYKWITERTGRWSVGEEYPFSRQELDDYCRLLDVDDYGFFGDSLWRSKKFLNPLKWLPRRKKKTAATTGTAPQRASARKPRRYRRLPRRERGSPWDSRYSYALVLCATKPKATAQRVESSR